MSGNQDHKRVAVAAGPDAKRSKTAPALSHEDWYRMGCRTGALNDRLWDMFSLVQSRYGTSATLTKRYLTAKRYFEIHIAGGLDSALMRAVYDSYLDLSSNGVEPVLRHTVFYSMNRNPHCRNVERLRPLPKTLTIPQQETALQLTADVRAFVDEFEDHIGLPAARTMRRMLDRL